MFEDLTLTCRRQWNGSIMHLPTSGMPGFSIVELHCNRLRGYVSLGVGSEGFVSQKSTKPPTNVQAAISPLTGCNRGYTSTKHKHTNRFYLPYLAPIHSISRCVTLPSTRAEKKSKRATTRRNSLLQLSAQAQTRR